jgi:hypothetical protein
MTSRIAVVAYCSQEAGMLPLYRQQLKEANIDLHLTTGVRFYGGTGNGGMLVTKCEAIQQEVKKLWDYNYLIFTDAWDVLFYGTEQEVVEKLDKQLGRYKVLLMAERVCWPDGYLSTCFEGDTIWRFVNGGVMAGSPGALLNWASSILAHPTYIPQIIDQQWMNHRLLMADPLINIDSHCNTFYCMNGDRGEMICKDGLPYNTVTCTTPNWLHFSGNADPAKWQFMWALSKLKKTKE